MGSQDSWWTVPVASLVIVVSAVRVLSCGQTMDCTVEIDRLLACGQTQTHCHTDTDEYALLPRLLSTWSTVSIQSQSWLPLLQPSIPIGWRLRLLRENFTQQTQAPANRNARGNHDWLLANASACVSCDFRLRNARNASDCVWMETGLEWWQTYRRKQLLKQNGCNDE